LGEFDTATKPIEYITSGHKKHAWCSKGLLEYSAFTQEYSLDGFLKQILWHIALWTAKTMVTEVISCKADSISHDSCGMLKAYAAGEETGYAVN
jgi:hypothetical protein